MSPTASRRGSRKADAVGLTALTRGPHGDAPNDPPCGSLDLSDNELSLAFDFFDVIGKGTLSQAELKARLAIFYPNLPAKEYAFLISEPNFSKQTLRTILSYQTDGLYDPVRDAFAVYDPQQTGFADPAALRTLFQDLGYGEITDDDLLILISATDADGDGRISLDDFRKMLSSSAGPPGGDPKPAGAATVQGGKRRAVL